MPLNITNPPFGMPIGVPAVPHAAPEPEQPTWTLDVQLVLTQDRKQVEVLVNHIKLIDASHFLLHALPGNDAQNKLADAVNAALDELERKYAGRGVRARRVVEGPDRSTYVELTGPAGESFDIAKLIPEDKPAEEAANTGQYL